METRQSRLKWSMIGVGAAVVATGMVGYASIPDASGTIHGCYRPGAAGYVRLVDGVACQGAEQAIHWSARGPAGPAGPPGPAGAPGATSVQWRSAQGVGFARAFCLAGEVLV